MITLNRWLTRNFFYALWVLAGVVALYGYWSWQTDPYLVGTVVSKLHSVGAREGGTIQQLGVAIGDRVAAGQILARLDISDLSAEKRRLQEELSSLETIMAADRQRYNLEYDLLHLRISEQYAAVQANLAELDALGHEIHALVEAEAAGLGHDRDLARMTIRRDALQRSVSEQSALIRPEVLKLHADDFGAYSESIMTSLLGDRMERIHETLHALTLTEQRVELRTVRAPCEGQITEILALTGSTINAFSPIITVQDTSVAFVEVYVPETQDMRLEAGQMVEVYSNRSREFDATGRIGLVYPGYSPIPERLWLRGQMLWARKLRVTLDKDHSLLPGESVRVRVL